MKAIPARDIEVFLATDGTQMKHGWNETRTIIPRPATRGEGQGEGI